METVDNYRNRGVRAAARWLWAAMAALAMVPAQPVCGAAADGGQAGEDGSRLWLRMAPAAGGARITAKDGSAVAATAVRELSAYWRGGDVLLQRDNSLPDDDGFVIDFADGGAPVTVRARRSAGLLYGAYELLRRQQLSLLPAGGTPAVKQYAGGRSFVSRPAVDHRVLNHWDNPDGSVERGYAGKSIWKWDEINGGEGTMSIDLKERITMYARANASIGINGSVLNNVNASPCMLTAEYINKVKVIADLLRPYGIRTYLSVNFASPMAVGGLETADPLDPRVAEWWKKKVKEIYAAVPDFGGFLVKANSEGQPGPGDYGRTHADGANMLAGALAPYKGIVMWRSFVYGNHEGEDRVMQAVTEFKGLDGKFAPNVVLQSKNGPLDFQPREPYAPIFDQMRHTPMWAELQITQEYLGQSLHLVYLAPMWSEFFKFVNIGNGRGAAGPCGREAGQPVTGLAGVANTGDDANWCGHHFSQANWYAFGRMAWAPSLTPDSIAREWLGQTFTPDTAFVNPVAEIMTASREACVDYMMPLGLHHIFKADHHYGPEPQGYYPQYPIEWCPVYYHKADSLGIGFDRTRTGTGAVAQYRHPYDSIYNSLEACPEEYLLWFHHVSWDHKMKNGLTLWQDLRAHYDRGVAEVERFAAVWRRMRPYVDERRFGEVSRRLDRQLADAKEWRDVCIGYFSRVKGSPD